MPCLQNYFLKTIALKTDFPKLPALDLPSPPLRLPLPEHKPSELPGRLQKGLCVPRAGGRAEGTLPGSASSSPCFGLLGG